MNGFMNKLEAMLDKYMTPVAEVLNNNIVISGIKDGMMSTLPATMIASVALILSSFPYLDKFCPPLSAAFRTFFGPINGATLMKGGSALRDYHGGHLFPDRDSF